MACRPVAVPPNGHWAWLLVIGGSSLLFSLQALFVKLLVQLPDSHLGAIEFSGFRGVVALFYIAPLLHLLRTNNDYEGGATARPGELPPTRLGVLLLFLRALCGWGGATFMFLAVTTMHIGDAQAIGFTSPILSAALAPYVGRCCCYTTTTPATPARYYSRTAANCTTLTN